MQQTDRQEEVRGTIEVIRFFNDSFLIAMLDNGITVKGSMLEPQLGIEYTFQGSRKNHPKFGMQFEFTGYQANLPASKGSVLYYIANNAKWIGPSIAGKLFDAYGADTLPMLKKHPERVAQAIKGLSIEHAKEASQMLRDNEANERAVLDLKAVLGDAMVGSSQITQMLELWRHEAAAYVRKYPYKLPEVIRGIGFHTADEIAFRLGYDRKGRPRVEAGVLHCLKEASRDGHVCLPFNILMTKTNDLLGIGRDWIENIVHKMAEGDGDHERKLVLDNGYVYSLLAYDDEIYIARKVQVLMRSVPIVHADLTITGAGLFEDQKRALEQIKSNNVFICTGSPGCLDAETKIIVKTTPKRSGGRTYTIEEAYHKYYNIKREGVGKGKNKFWHSGHIQTLSLVGFDESSNGNIGYNTIERIVYSGFKVVYELSTESGKHIRATSEHPFKVPAKTRGADREGFRKLRNLKPGDKVVTRRSEMLPIGNLHTEIDTIKSIKKIGIRPTYDLVMAEPYRNYVAQGFVVHNTGKSHMIKQILKLFPFGHRVALCAPTGKAAKRMSELTGKEARTIHSLLEPLPVKGNMNFTRNESNPLEAQVVIVDEISMADNWLMASLLKAVDSGSRLILIGDTNQLPAVGAGNVLHELIDSEMIPFVELDEIKRQDPGLIIQNCHAIKNGVMDIEFEHEKSLDFLFLDMESQEAISDTIEDILKSIQSKKNLSLFGGSVQQCLAPLGKLNVLRDVQVISPLREKTDLSVKALNMNLQKLLNHKARFAKPGKRYQFFVGDKVIQRKNEYDLGIINGDMGIVSDVDTVHKEIEVVFDNPKRTVSLPLNENNLELAYAITCHSFQGSEAPVIIIPIHPAFGGVIMQRNWLYTAISRAQKLCILIGHRSEVPRIIGRASQQVRYTQLASKINPAIDEGW